MNSAESPRNETTKLRALATGLRLMTTAAPKISVISAKNQNRNGDIIDCGSRIACCGNKDGRRVENQQLAIGNWQSCSFLFVPFQHDAVHYSADFQQLLLVMHHFRAREASDGIIFLEANRLFVANLLTHPAKNAPDHIDMEFLRIFLDLSEQICGRNFARNNLDRVA